MKKIIIICMLISGLLTGCQGNEVISEIPDESSDIQTTTIKEISTEPLPDFVLNMDNILFTSACNYAYDCQDPLKYCMMFIRTDGQVYSCSAKSGTFFKTLYECDNAVWDMAEDITHIGTLTDSELSDLIKYTENIDLNSEAKIRDAKELRPEVEVFDSYTSYSYKWDSDGNKKSFHIISHDATGVSYETLDENALNALELIRNSESYNLWLSECSRVLGIEYLNAEVLEVYEKSALIKSDNGAEITIPTLLPDGTTVQIRKGDEIEIKFDGNILETYPEQIKNIYDIRITEKCTAHYEKESADNAIQNLMDSEDFQNMTTSEKADAMLELLNDIAENGTEEYKYSLIEKDSIIYDGKDIINFTYKFFGQGTIKLEPFDPEMN